MTYEEYLAQDYPKISDDSFEIFTDLIRYELDEQEKILSKYQKGGRDKGKIDQIKAQINYLSTMNLWDVVRFHTDEAVRIVNNAIDVLSDTTYFHLIRLLFKNKLNCTENVYPVKEEFVDTYKSLLQHKYALRSGEVTYQVDEDYDKKVGPGSGPIQAYTSNATRNKTTFSASMIWATVTSKRNYQDSQDHEVRSLTKTFIHETFHRVNIVAKDFNFVSKALNLVVENKYAEVYEDQKLFSQLSCRDHLNNADSFAVMAFQLDDGLRRIKSAKIEGEVATLLEIRKINAHETLWFLADRYYGKGIYWKYLWEDNKGRLRSGDPNLIYPDEVIVINLMREFDEKIVP